MPLVMREHLKIEDRRSKIEDCLRSSIFDPRFGWPLVLRHRLDGEVGWARAPVAVQDAVRGLLVLLVAVGPPGHREVELPEEHRANPGGVVVATQLESPLYPGRLCLVGDAVPEFIAGRIIWCGPAELGDPNLAVAQTIVQHRGADVLDAPE